MADWTLPTETSQYLQVLANLKDRDVNAATWGEGGYVNPPISALRFDRASGHPYTIQEWDGAAWQNKILSVASGGTGANNLNDFKASLGLGSMAYQNANTVAITGGSMQNAALVNVTINTNGIVTFYGETTFISNSSGLAFKIGGRLADNYSAIVFYNNPLTVEFGRFAINSAGILATNMTIQPTANGTLSLGGTGAAWKQVNSYSYQSYSAVSPNGYLFNDLTNFGIYYSTPYASLAINAAHATPAMLISYAGKDVVFGGIPYPIVNAQQTLGLISNQWSVIYSIWYNAPSGGGGYMIGNNTDIALKGYSNAYPGIYYGTVQQYWTNDHTNILGLAYFRQVALGTATIANATNQTNFISFATTGFGFNTVSGNTLNVLGLSVTVAGGARLALSPLGGSDANLKFYWETEVHAGMWMEGVGSASKWHFNAGSVKLITLMTNYATFASPAVMLFHTIPNLTDALWLGYAGWKWYSGYFLYAPTIGSDKRQKDIIGEEKLGLNFINRLEPIMYRMPSLKWKDDKYKVWHGLAAQDVEKVLSKLGIEFAGMDKVDDEYGLRYTEFIGPIIKAIQELDRKVEDAKAQFLARQ